MGGVETGRALLPECIKTKVTYRQFPFLTLSRRVLTPKGAKYRDVERFMKHSQLNRERITYRVH